LASRYAAARAAESLGLEVAGRHAVAHLGGLAVGGLHRGGALCGRALRFLEPAAQFLGALLVLGEGGVGSLALGSGLGESRPCLVALGLRITQRGIRAVALTGGGL